MTHLPIPLQEDYHFWETKLTDFDKKEYSKFVNSQEVLKAHYLIVDYFQSIGEELNCGIKDFPLIGSAVGRQFTSWNGRNKWDTVPELGASLFYGLNKNHAFVDGNKRTSLLILLYFIIKNGYLVCDGSQKDFENLAVYTAANELEKKYSFAEKYKNENDKEVKIIAHFLRKHTRKADKNYYCMTYQELEGKLKKYGFYFKKDKNYASLYKKKHYKDQFIMQIGYPGEKKQINMKALKEVIKKCGFTPENGFDIKSFLEGTESMYKLIYDYEGPLRRLKDK